MVTCTALELYSPYLEATGHKYGGAVAEAMQVFQPSVCLQNDEKAMVEAVALHNPVSFAFEVTEDFMLYQKGIYSR